MCFGNTETGSKTTTSTANPAVAAGATSNLNFVQGLQNQGFTPYSGQQVANFGPLQSQSFGTAGDLSANGGIYSAPAAADINRYGSAPASSVSANTISSAMSPYMNAYVQNALAPQIQMQDQQFAQQNQANDAAATSSGAYGDSRAGIQQANTSQQQDIARTGLIGNAYNSAFNTAIGAGAQDVSNNLNAQTTNASLSEQSLNRALGAATGLEGLGNYQQGINNTTNTLGQQQTAQSQAGLTANYNQWLMGQQYPFQTAQLMNQTTAAGAGAMPASTTATTSAPDNSGWAAAGAIGSALFLSDEREKENIQKVGKLDDGTPVKRFNYKADPQKKPQIGLVAQDVEKKHPDAVVQVGNRKYVNYDRATGGGLEGAFGLREAA
jgi:Chaperone of endosialidase